MDQQVIWRTQPNGFTRLDFQINSSLHQLFFVSGHAQGDIDIGSVGGLDKQDTILDSKLQVILYSRLELLDDQLDDGFRSFDWDRDRNINIQCRPWLSPSLNGKTADDDVWNLIFGKEPVEFPNRLKQMIHCELKAFHQ